MNWPMTEPDLVVNRYVFHFAVRCKGRTCSALLKWYRTPAGKWMPVSQVAGKPDLWEPHWASCPDAKDFKNP